MLLGQAFGRPTVVETPQFTIKQPAGSGMCAVCVAAMATNTTVEDVYAFLNDGRQVGDPILDQELAMYLLKHGWLMGYVWQLSNEDAPGIQIGGEPRLDITREGALNDRAYVVVKSRNYSDCNHAVYWDGGNIRDPDPGMPDTTLISDYKVVQIWPLTWLGYTDITKRLTCNPAPLPYFVKKWRKKSSYRFTPAGEPSLEVGK